MGNRHSSAQLSCFSLGRRIIAKKATSFSGAAVHPKVKAIMQVLIELRLAPDKISSLCQVPADSLVGLLPVNYSPIEINYISTPQIAEFVDQILTLEATSIGKGSTRRTQTIQMPNGDTFTGKLLGGLPAGEGTYTYAEDGRVCVGSWLNGQMQGPCEITWPNGKRLKGHFDGNRLINYAEVKLADGGVYEGKLTEDYQLTGLGILKNSDHQFMRDLFTAHNNLYRFRNGNSYQLRYHPHEFDCVYVYIGHFTDGMMQGYGVAITSFGLYEGEWQQDLFHGQGTCVLVDDYYSGSWVDGVMHGFGISNFYEGFTKYGVRSGVGTDKHYTGDFKHDRLYTGGFKDDKYHGYGVLRDYEGQYEGEWRNGLKHGAGTHKLSKGGEHDGHYIDNQRSGYGVMHYANGDRYEGNWRNDTIEGDGKMNGYETGFGRRFEG
jgi:hypothetical protein